MATNNATNTSNPITVPQGGTGVTTLTNHGVIVGAGSSNLQALAVGSTGQLLVGASAANPAFAASASGDFTFTTSAAGTSRILSLTNTDNSNTSSDAILNISVGGSSSGCGFIREVCSSTRSYAIGPNNNDAAQPLYIVTAATNTVTPRVPTGGVTILTKMDTNGSVTMPSRPNASVFLTTGLINATGDGTFINPVIFDTKNVDQQSNYSTVTGIFTVPTTGIYLISLSLTYTNLTASHSSCEVAIVLNGSNYSRAVFNPGVSRDASNNYTYNQTIIALLTATSVVSIATQVSGSTKTVGISGTSFGSFTNANFSLIS